MTDPSKLHRISNRVMLSEPYAVCLKNLKLESLEMRRLKMDISTFYNILNGFMLVDTLDILEFTQPTRFTRNARQKLRVPMTKHSVYNNSYFIRMSKLFNQLPTSLFNLRPSQFHLALSKLDLCMYLSLK